MDQARRDQLETALQRRFGDAPHIPEAVPPMLSSMAARGSCRRFLDKPVSSETLEFLCSIALSAPSKSDLQQRDIVLLDDPDRRKTLAHLVAGQEWVAQAPTLVVFCGNNRRQRQIHNWHEVPFANDHLDAFFNAAVDAGIALSAFVTAAEALGLGCCPISAVRNEAQAVSNLLKLPEYVFPVAGLAVGYAAATPPISKRLPLNVTVHRDTFDETGLEQAIWDYDTAREAAHPYAKQRFVEDFGEVESYGWSKDKARQYSRPERADFGAFIRQKGFRLD